MAWRRWVSGLVLALWSGAAWAAGELHVHTWEAYLAPELVAKFERETGIKVTVHTVTNYFDLINQLASGRSGFDVTVPADYQVRDLAARGLIEKFNADRLPGFWNIEDNWRSRAFDPSNDYTIPHLWGTTGLVADESIKGASLSLLFEPPPQAEGRVVLLDSGGDMIQLALMYLREARCSADPVRLRKAEEALVPLVRRNRLATIATIIDHLAEPGVSLAVAWNGDAMRARARRPGLRFVYPAEGSLVFTDVWAMAANPPNRAAALKWLAFMLKPENAAMQSAYTGYANMIRGSERNLPDEMLTAPEIISPASSRLTFFSGCDGAVQRMHEELWVAVKARAAAP